MKTIFNKRAVFFLTVLLTGAVLFSGCSLFQKRYEKTEKKEVTVNVTGKKKVVLDNTNGNVKIIKSSNDSLLRVKAEGTFHLTKKELNENKERIKFSIDSSSSTIKIETDYTREKHFINFQFNFNSDISYELSVPEGIDVSVDNTNGKAEVEDVSNNVSINITNGSVRLHNTTGIIKTDITNGKISGELDSAKGLNLKTTNGSISLSLGEKFSGRFRIETSNGKINTKDMDFKDINSERKYFKGTLGNSDADMIMETVNGSVKLTKK